MNIVKHGAVLALGIMAAMLLNSLSGNKVSSVLAAA